jgi:propanediol utilization protein
VSAVNLHVAKWQLHEITKLAAKASVMQHRKISATVGGRPRLLRNSEISARLKRRQRPEIAAATAENNKTQTAAVLVMA